VVDAAGASRLVSATATLAAYRPALILITGVAAIGTLVALSGLRGQRDLTVTPADEVPEVAEAAGVRELARDSTAG